MENKTLDLIKELKELNVTIIENKQQFNDIVDINEIKKDVFNIKIKKDVVIFFDYQSYNSNTFTDSIINFLKDFENITFTDFSKMFSLDNNDIKKESEFYNSFKTKVIQQVNNTKIYYCNDLSTFNEIFFKLFNDPKEIQSTILSLKYKPDLKSECFIDTENLNVLNLRNIMKVFFNLKTVKL